MSARLQRPSSGDLVGGGTFPYTKPAPSHTSPKVHVPEIDEALIAYLEAAFPLRVCSTLDEYRRVEGHREIIQHLRSLLLEDAS